MSKKKRVPHGTPATGDTVATPATGDTVATPATGDTVATPATPAAFAALLAARLAAKAEAAKAEAALLAARAEWAACRDAAMAAGLTADEAATLATEATGWQPATPATPATPAIPAIRGARGAATVAGAATLAALYSAAGAPVDALATLPKNAGAWLIGTVLASVYDERTSYAMWPHYVNLAGVLVTSSGTVTAECITARGELTLAARPYCQSKHAHAIYCTRCDGGSKYKVALQAMRTVTPSTVAAAVEAVNARLADNGKVERATVEAATATLARWQAANK